MPRYLKQTNLYRRCLIETIELGEGWNMSEANILLLVSKTKVITFLLAVSDRLGMVPSVTSISYTQFRKDAE